MLSFAFTAFTIFLIWDYHMFVMGFNPFLGSIFLVIALILAIPIIIFLFRKLSLFLKGKLNLTPDVLFLMGLFSLLTSAITSEMFSGSSTLDIHLHDTYFIMSNAYIMICIAIIFGTFSAIYHWFPKVFRRQMNYPMGYIHFWITLIGGNLIYWPMHYEGIAGMPRRYIDYGGWTVLNEFERLNNFISYVGVVVLVAQLLFVFNFIYSIFKGRKA